MFIVLTLTSLSCCQGTYFSKVKAINNLYWLMGEEKMHALSSASIRSLQTQTQAEFQLNFEDFMYTQVTGLYA